MTYRTCAECEQDLDSDQYTNNQRSKGRGLSRCVTCVHGYQADREHANDDWVDSARRNYSSRATFSTYALENPFAEGAFRWVARGRYTNGPRKGQACVCKWFKTGTVFEDTFFEEDINAVDKALGIVDKFNNLGIVNKIVKLNVPEVWTFEESDDYGYGNEWDGSMFLQEPFIQNYRKFNSNSGWNDDTANWPRVMQALSHFSYHISGGQHVLCDLQGGIYRDFIVLSDPVVLSRRREFGVTDLGPMGISSFFSQHECNEYCRPTWTQPADQRQHFRPVAGTTMISRGIQTQRSRPANTLYY